MKTKPHIEIILPIYNEEKNISKLIEELDRSKAVLQSQAKVTYLFINDGSVDRSLIILKKLFQNRADVRIVNLIHNFGHGAAITCGLKYFNADAAILMDADLQDSPAALIPLFEAWLEGNKTVVIERGERKEKTRLLFNLFYLLLHKAAPKLPPINFGTHCLLDKTVIRRIRTLSERNRYFPGLVSFASGPIHSIRIDRNARNAGKSRVGTFGLFQLAITAVVSFSSMPVSLVSFLGLMCAGASLACGFLIIFIKFFTALAIPGWASQMTAIAFASGIQLLCIGIIGEYVARIYDEVKKRPLYLVDDVMDKAAEKDLPLDTPVQVLSH